jgi:hypothetical protein
MKALRAQGIGFDRFAGIYIFRTGGVEGIEFIDDKSAEIF